MTRGLRAVTALCAAALATVVFLPTARATAAIDGYIAVGDAASGEIFTVTALGTNRTQVTHNRPGEFATGPMWSPDGRHIVFVKTLTTGYDRMFTIAADGTELHKVRSDGAAWNDETPSYSPDGTTLVFTRCHLIDPGSCTINSVGLDGTGLRQLTPPQSDVFDFHPEISPDGKYIAFQRFNYHGAVARIWVMRADGSDSHPITGAALEAYSGSWESDSDSFLVSSNCCRNGGDIYRVPLAGGAPVRLTTTSYPNYSGSPSLAPSGREIAFVSDRRYPDKSANDLFIMGADGQHEVLVNTGLDALTSLAWGPSPYG